MSTFACRFFCFVLFTLSLLAQSERGTITGRVTDASGAVVPRAKVTITETATNVSANSTTTDAGDFTFASLPVGRYTVRVEADGFKPAVTTGVVLNASASVRVDTRLEVGTAQQAIEVEAAAVELQTTDARSTSTITNKLVDELPLVVGGALRSPFDLAVLTPEANNFGDNAFSIGGGQGASFGATLDGVSANTTRALSNSWVAVNSPSLEAITEFTVESNGYKAEYGHAGGGVMTFVSKSGTNQFHGSAYEFLRNNDLDANNFFANRVGAARAIYKQNDFGFSAGGPVWIPKLIHGKDKTFFFVSWEAFRNRNGANARTVSVPTPDMYKGDFSQWVNSAGTQIPIYDPSTTRTGPNGTQIRDQFPGNIIPASRFDPQSAKLLGVFQQSGVLGPNNGAAPGTLGYVQNNYIITNGTVQQPQTKFSVKGDHNFSEKNRLSGFYGRNRSGEDPGPDGPATLPGNYTDYNNLSRNSDVYRMSWDHTFNPTLLNHFYAGGNNWRENHDPPQASKSWKDQFCLGNVPDCNQNLAQLTFANNNTSQYQTWGAAANNGSENTVYSFNNDLTWIRNKHSFKFGGTHQRNHYNGFGRQAIAGRADFSFTGTGRPGDTNFTTAGGNAFASFLLGYADSGGIDTIRFISQQWPYFAGYAQDDWRITQKLVLNLGLRWETTLPPVEANDRWSDFSPTRPNPGAGNIPGALIYAGSGQGREGSRSLADSYFKAFGPHVGLAYSISDKTVIRSNYARSFGAITTVTGSAHQQGFTQTVTFGPNGSNGLSPQFLMKDGVPAYGIPPFIDPSFVNGQDIFWWQNGEATHPPTFDNWNFSIQRQLTSSLVLEASYNGVAGSHLQTSLLRINQIDPRYLTALGPTVLTSNIDSPAAQAAGIRAPFAGFSTLWKGNATVLQALKAYPQYNNINTLSGGGDHSGHSSYHAAILKLEKRYSSGLTLNTSYVFSKLLTDADSYWGAISGVANPTSTSTPTAAAADQYNRRLEKSIGAYDVTHNFKLGLVYDLPFGSGKKFLTHGVGAWVLGNWRISSIQIYTSGTPVNLTTSVTQPINSGRQVPFISSYDNWAGPQNKNTIGQSTDFFFDKSAFPAQPSIGIGNSTRFNPKLRTFPNYTENISLGKTFPIHEQVRLDLRWEAFNVFNRTRFGTGSTQIQNLNFGRLTGANDLLNTPRQMQLGLKLYW
jgi:hypothetical protein